MQFLSEVIGIVTKYWQYLLSGIGYTCLLYTSIMAVSPISPEQEMTGVLLEAMNAESYYGDAMAYYDVVLKHKAMRDEDSIRMLEIIRSTRTMNFEYAFGYLGLQLSLIHI